MAARAFFTALAIPLATSVTLVVAALFFGPRGPLVALLVNAFVLCEVAGLSQVFGVRLPAGYFRPRRVDQRWLYELLGVALFRRLMRSRRLPAD